MFAHKSQQGVKLPKSESARHVSQDEPEHLHYEGCGHKKKVYLAVTVVEARDLVSLEKSGSDPYVTVSVGKRLLKSSKAKHKTKPVKKTVEPVWNKRFVVKSKHPDRDTIYFQVWDWSRITATKPLGETTVSVASVLETGRIDEWITLDHVKKGELHVIVTREDDSEAKKRKKSSSSKNSAPSRATTEEDLSSSLVQEESENEVYGELETETEKQEMIQQPGHLAHSVKGSGINLPTLNSAPRHALPLHQLSNTGDGSFTKWASEPMMDKNVSPPESPRATQSPRKQHAQPRQRTSSQSSLHSIPLNVSTHVPLIPDSPPQSPRHHPHNHLHHHTHNHQSSNHHKTTNPAPPLSMNVSSAKWKTTSQHGEAFSTLKQPLSERAHLTPTSIASSGTINKISAYQIYVNVVEAKDLLALDHGGTSDPYVTVSIDKKVDDPKKAQFKTRHIMKNLDPVWKQEFVTESKQPDVDSIYVQVWDWNKIMKHQPLGEVEIPAREVVENNEIDAWFDLQNVDSGQIHLKLTSALITDRVEKTEDKEMVNLGNITLLIKVVEARELDKKDDDVDPYVTVNLGKLVKRPEKALFKTAVGENADPEWDQDFEIANINMRKLDQPNIYLQVWDERGLLHDRSFGHATVPILQIVKSKEPIDKWYQLEGVKHGKLHVITSFTVSDMCHSSMDQVVSLSPDSRIDIEPTVPATGIERILEHPVSKAFMGYGHLLLAVVVCYFMGYWGLSKAWLLLVGFFIYQIDRRWKKEEFKRRYAKQQLIRKSMIVQHETESAEWLNVFIRKIWPRFTPYLANTLKETLGKSLKELLEETKPPVVEEINIESVVFKDSEVPLDILSIKSANYPYYQLDIAVEYHSAIRVVAVIGASAKVTTINLPICIKDLYIKGVLRANIYLSEEFPFISLLEVAFKTKPSIGIRIQPLYSVNLLDVPLLHDWILRTITTAIKQSMVLPQRLTIDLGLLSTGHHVHVAKDLKATTMKVIGQKKLAKERKLSDLLDMNSALKKLHAQLPSNSMASGPGKKIATLKVVQIKARDLKSADKNGKSDPYAIMRVGKRARKTDVQRKTLNPDWGFTTEFPVYENTPRYMDLLLMDWNRAKKHMFLGVGVLDFSDLVEEEQNNTYTVKLQGVVSGKVIVELVFYKEVAGLGEGDENAEEGGLHLA